MNHKMKILHICAGWQKWNGAANIARMIMDEQRREGHEVSSATWAKVRELRAADEVWIHCGWLPCLWWAALWGRNVRWMPEACYDPVRLGFHSWKKWLVGPIERWCLRRCDRIVATCEAEKGWIERYLGKKCPAVEVTDVKRFFDFSRVERVERVEERGVGCRVERVEGLTRIPRAKRVAEGDALAGVRRRGAEYAEDDGKLPSADGGLHLLYLGRRHPLKGIEYLEKAVAELNSNPVNPVNPVQNSSARLTTSALSASLGTRFARLGRFPMGRAHPQGAVTRLCVRLVSNAYGEELEKVWQWCDVLVLPTLSDNFGLVIAEALERGKCVITTDGAPAWGENLSRVDGGMWSGYGGRLIYLKGYRDGTPEDRVRLLKSAIENLLSSASLTPPAAK